MLLLMLSPSSMGRRSSRPLDFSGDLITEQVRQPPPHNSIAARPPLILPAHLVRQDQEETTTEEPPATTLAPIDDDDPTVPEGYFCMNKVMMVEETVYKNELKCQHVYQESCFTSYKTEFKPTEVQ